LRPIIYFASIFIFLTAFQVVGQTVSSNKYLVKTEEATQNIPSALDTLALTFNGFSNDLVLKTQFPFQLSFDAVNFSDSIASPLASGLNRRVYVRLFSNQKNKTYRSEIEILNGANSLNDKIYLIGSTIESAEAISVGTWNIKWFGLPTKCGCDTNLARENVTTLLKELDLDIIALQEIVNEDQLSQVVHDLGPEYRYVLANYASQVQSQSSSGYLEAQKLAYIYNQTRIQRTGNYGLLKSTYPSQQGSNSPYYYFASGRWPFVFSGQAISTGEKFTFLNIHGKAFSGSTEHNRRAGAALEMTDALNTNLPNEKIIVTGDYNDLLEGAITSGFSASPYAYMLQNNFVGITLPSVFPGENTYLGISTSLIDNFVVSDRASFAYVPNSTLILKEASKAIFDFRNTTSDHIPVISHFYTSLSTALIEEPNSKTDFQVLFRTDNSLRIRGKELLVRRIHVYSLDGKLIFEKKYQKGERIQEELGSLSNGLYVVSIETKSGIEYHKWLSP
jgi:endonuclease/exonuclease/phosphatase family metal-dependent hydrolase